jgi:peroxiredoxin
MALELQEQPEQAPDFELADLNGKAVCLSDYRGKAHVVLVFNRGFA